jgi:ribosomal protein S16
MIFIADHSRIAGQERVQIHLRREQMAVWMKPYAYLSDNVLVILERRYLLHYEQGKLINTPT